MKYITNDNYEELTSANKFVVIDFYADWCGPCQMYGPIFENMASTNQGALMVKCDVEESKRVAARFGIRSIPTTVVIKDKELIARQSGILWEDQLKQFVNDAIKQSA